MPSFLVPYDANDETDTPDAPPAQDLRVVRIQWGNNVISAKVINFEFPDSDTMTVTLEDIDLSGTAFSGAVNPPDDV